ncbi:MULTISPECIES: iron ABC transporter permease [unclassified Devosia]|uniref:ABC transporter permease n=1 Tax=unclassified Devosia TaxID=196773 RepID=UPI0023D7DC69|nr:MULTISPECIES: iron ABC transporter permease [unclassified Devosia]WEJ31751.1 iron ABC transporter permease [Devosia sp. SD17-2]
MKLAGKTVDGWTSVALLLTGGYLFMVVWPLVTVLFASVTNGDGFSLDGFATFFSSRLYYGTLLNSLVVTVCVTVLAFAIAFPLAYFMTMFRIPGNRTIQVLILASMMSPPFIGAYSWILLLGNNGLITRWFKDIGLEVPSIYGFTGIVLVLTLQLVPLIFTYLMGAWRTIDVSLLEAAESMGMTGWRRAMKVITPLLLPTILGGSLLVFVRAFADFGTPMLIGQGFRTIPVLIYSSFVGEVSVDRSFAAAVAVIVIAVTLGVFLIQKYIVDRRTFSMTAMRAIEPIRLSGWKGFGVYAYVYGFLVLALAPLAVVVISSFRNTLYGQFVDGFSFRNYITAQRDIIRYITNTFSIGITALVLLVIVAVLVSYLTVRRKGALTGALDTMTMVPYVVPGLIIGIALITAFSQPPLVLTGTFAVMVLALAIRRLPYSVRSTTALMYQFSPSIEEAAVSLGASKFRTLVQVIVPALAPGIVSGAVLSWVTIITELSTTLFLYNTSTQTLSLGIYAQVIRGQLGTAAALSTILLILTMLSLFLLLRLSGGSKEIRL